MNWNDLTSIWSRQSAGALPGRDLQALSQAFRQESRKLSRRLFWRDLREMAAGLLGVAVFSVAALKMGRLGWPIWIANLLTLGVVLFFLRERVRAHRMAVGPEAPLLAKIEADIAELRHQYRLLMNVAVWYLGPLVLGWVLVMVSVGSRVVGKSPAIALGIGGYCCGALLFFGWVWKINRSAAQKKLAPRIEELEALRKSLLP